MKTIFENMITEIILVLAVFVMSTFASVDMQVMTARRIHSSALEQIQASYYTANIDTMNDKLHEDHPSWSISIDELNTYNARKEYRVSLIYEIVVPMFNIKKAGVIEGFTR